MKPLEILHIFAAVFLMGFVVWFVGFCVWVYLQVHGA